MSIILPTSFYELSRNAAFDLTIHVPTIKRATPVPNCDNDLLDTGRRRES